MLGTDAKWTTGLALTAAGYIDVCYNTLPVGTIFRLSIRDNTSLKSAKIAYNRDTTYSGGGVRSGFISFNHSLSRMALADNLLDGSSASMPSKTSSATLGKLNTNITAKLLAYMPERN